MAHYKSNIWVSYYYGGWHFSFNKTFLLPFAPFYNMEIDEDDNTVEFKNNDYCKTIISFSPKENEFNIDIQNIWTHPVTDETVDTTIEQFSKAGWERSDSTDIEALKMLMFNDYNRKKNFKFSE